MRRRRPRISSNHEPLRKYREENLAKIGMRGLFPLWNHDTSALAMKFIKSGFKAMITCVDSTMLDNRFTGRMYDEQFLTELPSSVDPCGENGEFHTFCLCWPTLPS